MRDRVPFLLYRASEISHSLANEMLAEMALSARQAGILTMVTELEPMTQKALADALRIDRRSSFTRPTPAGPPRPRPCRSSTSSNAGSWHP